MTEYIAHRGVHDVYAENTLDAFQRALELGFDAIELDVHVTANGICVVNHDGSVVTPSGALAISDTDFGTLHGTAPSLARLDAVLDLVAGKAYAYIELKARNAESAVADVLRKTVAEAAVHAFDHRAILRLRGILPQLRTGILLTSRLVDSVNALKTAQATDLWQWHEFIDRSLVEQVTAAGGRVIAWTANNPSEWRVFDDLGVAGICTDLPISPTPVSAQRSHPRGLSLDANN